MTVEIVKDLRGAFGLARDQDPRPTCMAFAASDAHASARGKWEPLSVEWAYYHALKREGSVPHRGVYMTTMLDTLRLDGQPVEAEWPYVASLFTDIEKWQPPAASIIFKRESAPVPTGNEYIIAQIKLGNPVLFTMSISKSFFTPASNGIIDADEPVEINRVHALIAVGCGKKDGKEYILVRNSWGPYWGIGGYAWLEAGYLSKRLKVSAIILGEI